LSQTGSVGWFQTDSVGWFQSDGVGWFQSDGVGWFQPGNPGAVWRWVGLAAGTREGSERG
jgi:hypothetical protein